MTHILSNLHHLILVIAVAIVAAHWPPAPSVAQNVVSYCFYDNNNVNVLIGDREIGFDAHPAGRPGDAQFYRRIAASHRYVADTGAVYAFFENGDATWSDGRQTIRLYRC